MKKHINKVKPKITADGPGTNGTGGGNCIPKH